jgi:hypothetical protein
VFWAGVHGLVSLELAGKLKLRARLASLIGRPMQQSMFIGNVNQRRTRRWRLLASSSLSARRRVRRSRASGRRKT